MSTTNLVLDTIASITQTMGGSGKNIATIAFYRPTLSAIYFKFSVVKCKLQIQLSPPDKSNNEYSSGRNYSRDVVKYDHDKKMVFSLELQEAYEIIKNFEKILKGEYKSEKTDQENTLLFDHVNNKQKLFITSIEDRDTKTPTIKLSLYKAEPKQSMMYIFRAGHELNQFKNIVDHFYKEGPWISLVSESMCKAINMAVYGIRNVDIDQDSQNKNVESASVEKSKPSVSETPKSTTTNDIQWVDDEEDSEETTTTETSKTSETTTDTESVKNVDSSDDIFDLDDDKKENKTKTDDDIVTIEGEEDLGLIF